MSRWIRVVPLIVVVAIACGLASAYDEPPAKDAKKPDAPKAPKPPTH